MEIVSGFKRNKLTLIKSLGAGNGKRKRYLWRCDCGNYTAVLLGNVRSDVTKSCGCLQRLKVSRHFHSRSPEYIILLSIRQRCTNPKNADYPNFSRLETPIDPRWSDDPKNFFSDMGPKPGKDYCLVRTDKKKGFFKENCAWLHKNELKRPKDPKGKYQITPKHRFKGEPIFISQFSKIIQRSEGYVRNRIRKGITLDEIYKGVSS